MCSPSRRYWVGNSSLKSFSENHYRASKCKLLPSIKEIYWLDQHTWEFLCLNSDASEGLNKCSSIITVHACVDGKEDITEFKTNQQNNKTNKTLSSASLPHKVKISSNQERPHGQTTMGGFTLMFSFFEKPLNAFLMFLQKLLHFPGVLFLSECHHVQRKGNSSCPFVGITSRASWENSTCTEPCMSSYRWQGGKINPSRGNQQMFHSWLYQQSDINQ